MRKAAAVLALVLGAAGVALALAAVVPLWTGSGRVIRAVDAVSGRVDHGLARAEALSQSAVMFLAETQDSARRFGERVSRRAAERRGVPTEEAEDLADLERRLRARLQLAAAWTQTLQSSMDLVEQALEVAESASRYLKQERRTKEDFVAAARMAQAEFGRTTRLVEDIGSDLARVLALQDVEASAARITSAVATIDQSLSKIRSRAEGFTRGISGCRGDFAALASRIRALIRMAALVGTGLLLWMAAAQGCLAAAGWRALRKPAA